MGTFINPKPFFVCEVARQPITMVTSSGDLRINIDSESMVDCTKIYII